MKLSDLKKWFKRKPPALFVRVVTWGDKEEGKRRGRAVGVYVGNWQGELFAHVYPDEDANRWKIEVQPGLPEVVYFPDEATRSPYGVKLDIPRTRNHAVALAAAHLRGFLS